MSPPPDDRPKAPRPAYVTRSLNNLEPQSHLVPFCRTCGARQAGKQRKALRLNFSCLRCGSAELPKRLTQDQGERLASERRPWFQRAAQSAAQRLTAAGIPAAVESETVVVDGQPYSWWTLTDPDRFFGELLAQAAPTLLLDQVRKQIATLPLTAALEEGLTTVSAGARPIACVLPTGMVMLATDDRFVRRIDGDMFAAGPHWTPAKLALQHASAPDQPSGVEPVTRAPRPAKPTAPSKPTASSPADPRGGLARPQHIELTPHNVSLRVLQQMQADSRTLKAGRRRAPEIPTELTWGKRTLLLFPVQQFAGIWELAFIYTHKRGRLSAALRLRTTSEPLALAIYDSNLENPASPWMWALRAAVQLTCDEPQSHGASAAASPGAHRTREPASYEAWSPPSGWQPSPATRAALAKQQQTGTTVMGCVMRIPGKTASPQAVQRALERDIELGPHETWRRPSLRVSGGQLAFTWSPDPVFKALAQTLSG